MDGRTDQTLVVACLRGDRDAFGVLADRYHKRVYAIAFAHLQNAPDAADCAQETFRRAYLKLDRLRSSERFGAWLCRIAFTVSRDHKRSAQTRDHAAVAWAHAHLSLDKLRPDRLLSTLAVAEMLDRALAALPEVLRVPLVMRYMEDLSYHAIGESLAISPQAAQKRVSRARAAMAASIYEAELEDECRSLLRSAFGSTVLAAPPAKWLTQTLGRAGAPAGSPTGTAAWPTCLTAGVLLTGGLFLGAYVAATSAGAASAGFDGTADFEALVWSSARLSGLDGLVPRSPDARPPIDIRALPGRFVSSRSDGARLHLWSQSISGGGERQLTFGDYRDIYPALSPDGRYVVFQRHAAGSPARCEIWVAGLDGGAPTQLTDDRRHSCEFPEWSADGESIIFSRQGWDGRSLRPPHQLYSVSRRGGAASALGASYDGSRVNADVSPDGSRMLFTKELAYDTFSIWEIDLRTGVERELIPHAGGEHQARYSPDGREIAFLSVRSGGRNIHRARIDGTGVVALTHSPPGIANENPSWSPDGSKIMFMSDRIGRPAAYVMRRDGTGLARVSTSGATEAQPVWGAGR